MLLRTTLGLAALLALAATARQDDPLLGLPAIPRDQRPDAALVALGEKLFFDPVLSVDASVSCASCHDPEHGFADPNGLALSNGVGGRKTLRNAPTLYNRAFGTAFMWNGQAETLEQQVLLPIENELEMAHRVDAVVADLAADAGYTAQFQDALGAPPSRTYLARALAAFVRSILYGGSRVDRFREGEHSALTPEERGGMWLFESRGGCWRCHVGANFTDEDFHNTGVGAEDGEPLPGRFEVTGDPADRGRFKTPTLRGLVETAPYMHDGSLATLEDVVEFYRRGGHPNANLDPVMAPVELTEQDAVNLVAFLRALSR